MRPLPILFFLCISMIARAGTLQNTGVPLSKESLVFTLPSQMPEENRVNLHSQRLRPWYKTPENSADHSQRDPAVTETVVSPAESFPKVTIEDLPRTPVFIMGKGKIGLDVLVSFLLSENNNADRETVETLAGFYITEAETEGINHDIAFAQMCLETGFLRFGGLVISEMNNFCGLGSIGPGQPGEWFPSIELGVRAHIQHLKAYASDQPLRGELADPRYHLVRKGSSPAIQGLSGSWAADKLYAEKIEVILGRLYQFKEQN